MGRYLSRIYLAWICSKYKKDMLFQVYSFSQGQSNNNVSLLCFCTALFIYQLTTVTLERLKKRGYELMFEHYYKLSPQLNELLCARSVGIAVRETTSSLTSGEIVCSITCRVYFSNYTAQSLERKTNCNPHNNS